MFSIFSIGQNYNWIFKFTASSILRKMDTSVDPCQNFYQFACGTFVKEAVIRDDRPSFNAFVELDDKIEHQLRTIVESKISDNEIRPFKLIRSLYDSCMNISMYNKIIFY